MVQEYKVLHKQRENGLCQYCRTRYKPVEFTQLFPALLTTNFGEIDANTEPKRNGFPECYKSGD